MAISSSDRPSALSSTLCSLVVAVASGAAYYGLVRLGEGVRVGAGSPRAYYVEVEESSGKAAPDGAHTAVCVVPRGVEEGFEAAVFRKPATGRQYRKLDGAAEARLVAEACSPPPKGRARWTLKLLADRLVELEIVESIGTTTVHETLKKTNSNRGKKSNG